MAPAWLTGKPTSLRVKSSLARLACEQYLTRAKPAVRQSQSMSGPQGLGNRVDELRCLVTAFRPSGPDCLAECRQADPLHHRVGPVMLQPELEHADGRRMNELRGHAEPRNQSSPAPGNTPGGAQIANFDLSFTVFGQGR